MERVRFVSDRLKPLYVAKYGPYFKLVDQYIANEKLVNGGLLGCSMNLDTERMYGKYFLYELYSHMPVYHANEISNILAKNGLDIRMVHSRITTILQSTFWDTTLHLWL